MYKNIHYDSFNKDIHLWDDIEGYQKFKYNEYAYVVDPKGEYTSIDGHKVKKTNQWSDSAVSLGLVYEHNVPATTRVLVDLYHESDDIAQGLVILPLDIEVAKEGAYSDPKDANNTITAISFYSYKENIYYCLLLDKNKQESEYDDVVNIDLPDGKVKQLKAKYFTYRNEYDLLKNFLREYDLISPDIITGWNVEFYDVPYLYTRICNVLGKDWAVKLSPIKICRPSTFGDYNQYKVSIAGVSVLDYLMLYKKFTYSEQPNYKLNTIALEELGRGKIEYDGDLQTLYETNIKKFAIYSIVDVEIIVALIEKLDLINIAIGICHKGHVPYEEVIFPSRYLDGAALVYCKRNNLIASSNKSESGNDEPAEGAFVKEPTPGLYKWIYDIDLTSLYPSNIISLNISPETKVARVKAYSENDYVANKERIYDVELIRDKTAVGTFSDIGFTSNRLKFKSSSELREYLETNNFSISSNGIIYNLNKVGLIPAILKTWFAERQEFNRLKDECIRDGKIDLSKLYDKKQLVTKIMLNSFYGVLLLKTFRFHDKENGEAVTVTGQSVIGFSMKSADRFYSKELGNINSLCIYVDTDSLFYSALPIIEHRYGSIDDMDDETIIKYALEVATEVQAYINGLYSIYAKKFHNVDNHMWHIKQELIAKRGLWLDAKKRYAQWIVNKQGHPVNKIDVKGIDVVRSNFPKSFRAFMKEILHDILHDKDAEFLNNKVQKFGKLIDDTYIGDIMLPTSVKELSKWQTTGNTFIKGTPVHVKAALNYNKLLDIWKIKTVPKIVDGDKILWCYVHKNEFGFESMALTGNDDPLEVLGFVSKYIDKKDLFENTLKNKLQSFWDALGWGSIVTNKKINQFFKFN